MNRAVPARGPGAGRVAVCDPQPVGDPRTPARPTHKFRNRQILEESGRTISQADEASAVARAIRPALNFHVRPRTPPSTWPRFADFAFSTAPCTPSRPGDRDT